MSVLDLFGPTGRAVAGQPEPWSRNSRFLFVAAALAATSPAWPIADELLSPADVAVVVPIVLILPFAWALLGRSRRPGRRVGALLAGLVALWSLGTVTLAGYATPSTVDDALCWYLVAAAIVVGGATVWEWRRKAFPLPRPRGAAGLAAWALAVATAPAVLLPEPMTPPADAVLPLPAGIELRTDQVTCHRFEAIDYCIRTMTVGSAGNAPVRDLARDLGRHLERSRGWRLTWYEYTPAPAVDCRRVGRLVNPYRLCLEIRDDPRTSTLEIHLGYANPHDPVY